MENPLNPRSSIINRSPLELKKWTFSLITLLLQASVLILICEITLNASSVYSEGNINAKSYSKEEFLKFILTFIAVYVTFVGFALFSNDFKLVRQINQTQHIYEKLKNYLEKQIKISFNTYSFKYISDAKTFKNFKKGKMKKVISHFEKEKLNFLSCRDISGLLDLDSQRLTKSESRIWVNLKIKLEYDIADELSLKDINTQKDLLISRNMKKDLIMDFVEEKHLSHFETNVLVHIGDKPNFILNKYFYLLFTFIFPVIEIYKIYLNSKVKYYELTIRKLISTRYNLKEPQFEEEFNLKNPKLIIKGKEYNYENFTFINQRAYELPTIEEIQNSRIINENLARKIEDYNIHHGFSPLELDEVKPDLINQFNNNNQQNENAIFQQNKIINSECNINELEDKYQKEFKQPTRSYSTSDTVNLDAELTVVNLNENKQEDLGNKFIQQY